MYPCELRLSTLVLLRISLQAIYILSLTILGKEAEIDRKTRRLIEYRIRKVERRQQFLLSHVHKLVNLQLTRGTYSNEASGFHFIIGYLYWSGGDGVLPRQLRCHGDSKNISSPLKENKEKMLVGYKGI
jgi:hypothetical protein